MKPSILLRIASVLTLVFCAGHTYRALEPTSRSAEEAAVFMAMQAYPFSIMGFRRTHWDFYRGFSLLFAVSLLLLALLLWQLGAMARSDAARTRPLVATLFAGYMGFTVLCGMYFFTAPAVFSAAVAICLMLAFTASSKAAAVTLASPGDRNRVR
jgi:RsiW-degrading membrane proteinase PrsW (M82 family)